MAKGRRALRISIVADHPVVFARKVEHVFGCLAATVQSGRPGSAQLAGDPDYRSGPLFELAAARLCWRGVTGADAIVTSWEMARWKVSRQAVARGRDRRWPPSDIHRIACAKPSWSTDPPKNWRVVSTLCVNPQTTASDADRRLTRRWKVDGPHGDGGSLATFPLPQKFDRPPTERWPSSRVSHGTVGDGKKHPEKRYTWSGSKPREKER